MIAEPADPAEPKIAARRALYETLTDRQREVARLLAMGRSCREIAEELHVETKTAETHRLLVLGKLQLRNAAELARDAIRVGFVPEPTEDVP